MLNREQKKKFKSNIDKSRRTILTVARERIVNFPALQGRYTDRDIEFIIKTFITNVIKHCILTQKGIKIPHGSGIIIIGKFKPRAGTITEKKAKITAYQRNPLDPYICKWTWKNDKYSYWGKKIPSRFFMFRPKRKAKQGLRYAILNGVTSDRFFHLHSKI